MNNLEINNPRIEALATNDLQVLSESLQIKNIQAEQNIERKNRQYGFLLDGEKLFFANTIKREIFENVTVKEIPLMPKYILGLYNVRGNLVPIYDLAVKFGFQSNRKKVDEYKILVVEDGADIVGFAVDKMLIAVDYYDDDLLEKEISVHKNISFFINKSFLIHNEAWHLIDHSSLYDSLLKFD